MADNVIGEAVIKISADDAAFIRGSKESGTKGGAEAGKGFSTSFSKALKGALTVGVGGALAAAVGVLKTGFKQALESEKLTAQLTAGIKSTGGAAKVTVDHLKKLTAEIKGYSGQSGASIVATEKLLLTFTKIKNNTPERIFDNTTKAAADMAAKMGGDASMYAIQLGKALNDPVKGLKALQRIGVTFDDTQKKLIEGYIEHGQVAKAQNVILKELSVEFGGAAQAAGGTLAGQLERTKMAFQDVSKIIVEQLIPVVRPALEQLAALLRDKIAPAVKTFIKDFGSATQKGTLFRQVMDLLLEASKLVGKALLDLWTNGMKVLGWMNQHQTLTKSLAVAVGALVVAMQAHEAIIAYQASEGFVKWLKQVNLVVNVTKLWSTIQWIMNGAMAAFNAVVNANPISLIIIAIIAMGAALFVLYKKSETFRNIVNAVWQAVWTIIKAVVDWIKNTAVPWLQDAWAKIAAGAQWLWTKIVAVWNAIKEPILAFVGWVTGTAVPFLVAAWNKIVQGAQWLWGIIVNVWNGITAAVQTAIGVVMVVLRPLITFFQNVLMPVFRTLAATVEAVFKIIEIIILAVWKLVIVPAFNAIKLAVTNLGPIFTWLWGIIKVAFDAIGTAISWVWNNIIKPVFNAIGAIITWVYNNIIKPYFEAIKIALNVLGTVFSWLYNNVIKPVWNAIGVAISFAWKNIIKPIWEAIKAALNVLGTAFNWIYNNVIKPVWAAIKSAISAAWTAIRPVFDAIKSGVGLVGKAFETVKTAIGTAWGALQDIVKKPITFMINTVMNNGIINAFNWLSKNIGGPHIDPIPLPWKAATGGVLPGWSPGSDIHQFFSPTGGRIALSGGEAIMRPEFTRAVGGPAGVAALNNAARAGQINPGVGDVGNVPGFAGGGVIGWINKQASNFFDWVGDKTSNLYNAVTHPLDYIKSKIPGMPTGAKKVSEYAGAAVNKGIGLAGAKVSGLWKTFMDAFGGAGGPKWTKMKNWIMGHLGIPYLWGGTGPRFDCSGFTQAAQRAGGVGIPRTAREQQAFAHAVGAAALRPGDLGFVGRPAHHVGIYMGAGKRAHSPHTGDVTKIVNGWNGSGGYGRTFDQGGVLRPGVNVVSNNTGRPEHLVPATGFNVTINVSVDDLAKMTKIADFVEMLEDARVNYRRTARSGVVRA